MDQAEQCGALHNPFDPRRSKRTKPGTFLRYFENQAGLRGLDFFQEGGIFCYKLRIFFSRTLDRGLLAIFRFFVVFLKISKKNRVFGTPLVVRLPLYDLNVLVDTGADCSMVSPEQAASILNQHSNVSLTKLNVPVPVEFGDKKTILCSQSVTLPDTLNDAPVTFLIVPNLSVSIVFGMSQIEQFSLLRPSWLMTALLPVASATADNDGD
jgi:hypothetical protein